jgi:hypothetical protein
MAKSKKYEAETETQAPVQTPAEQPAAEQQPAEKPAKEVKPRTFLAMAADRTGRTGYLFSKYTKLPKKANKVSITVDGETHVTVKNEAGEEVSVEREMFITSSIGYTEKPAYNGWLYDKAGNPGWIMFSDDVDPAKDFADGIHFVTTEGKPPANPVRLPKNPEVEQKRRDAASAKAKERADEKAKAAAEQAAVDAEEAAKNTAAA